MKCKQRVQRKEKRATKKVMASDGLVLKPLVFAFTTSHMNPYGYNNSPYGPNMTPQFGMNVNPSPYSMGTVLPPPNVVCRDALPATNLPIWY